MYEVLRLGGRFWRELSTCPAMFANLRAVLTYFFNFGSRSAKQGELGLWRQSLGLWRPPPP